MNRVFRPLVLAVASGIVLFGLEVGISANYTGERVLAYLKASWVLFLCFVLAAWLARRIAAGAAARRITGAAAFMILLYALDPYSYGHRGGHTGIQPEFMWQTMAALAACFLLLGAIILRHFPRTALWLLLAEALGFAVMNVIYVQRDGAGLRFYAGEFASPMPMLIVFCGVVARGYAVSLAFAPSGDSVGSGSSNAGRQ